MTVCGESEPRFAQAGHPIPSRITSRSTTASDVVQFFFSLRGQSFGDFVNRVDDAIDPAPAREKPGFFEIRSKTSAIVRRDDRAPLTGRGSFTAGRWRGSAADRRLGFRARRFACVIRWLSQLSGHRTVPARDITSRS